MNKTKAVRIKKTDNQLVKLKAVNAEQPSERLWKV
jgi:hypothetical protein